MRFLSACLLSLSLLAGLAPAQAQVRTIPAAAQTGKLTLLDHRTVRVEDAELSLLDLFDRSVERRLAPGARIFSADNRSITSNALPAGSIASYLLAADGQIRTVWVLSPVEFEAWRARPRN